MQNIFHARFMNPDRKSSASSFIRIKNRNYHGQNRGNYASERKIPLNINFVPPRVCVWGPDGEG